MKDQHLQSVRRAHALRASGRSWQAIASDLGVSIATARNRVAEYHERRQDGTLFTDLNATMDDDLYAHPSLRPQVVRKTDSQDREKPTT